MKKLINLKLEYLAPNTDLPELVERVNDPHVDLWMEGFPTAKKSLLSITVDKTTKDILDILEKSTERKRIRSILVNQLLMLGLKEFFRLRNEDDGCN